MGWSWRSALPVVLLSAALVVAADFSYRSVSVDSAGRLHIKSDSGRVTEPAMLKGQVSFRQPAISPDHQTVGWLVMYPFPSLPGANYILEPIPGALALYRGGHVIHRFDTDQEFWDWQFQDGGRHVAYSTGPTHGGAAECVLRDVDSGKVMARWRVKIGEEPPPWARTLRI